LDLELALRFLRRRTGVALRGTSMAAFAGVALAVTTLVITLALMNGYSRAIATALQRGNAHMVGFALGSLEPAEAAELSERIAGESGVERGAWHVQFDSSRLPVVSAVKRGLGRLNGRSGG